MRNGWVASAGMVLVAFALALYFSPQMPPKVAVHWGMEGNADGYAQREFGVYVVPVLMAALLLLLYVFPKIDPKRKNIEQFWGQYGWFVAALEVFLLYLQILVIAWNVGIAFNMSQMLAFGFAFLLFCAGEIIGMAKPNWTVGIRTPWTLSSNKVWEKTHKLGKKLFWAAALLCLLGAFFPKYVVMLLIVPIIAVALVLFIYSYFEYSKERKGK